MRERKEIKNKDSNPSNCGYRRTLVDYLGVTGEERDRGVLGGVVGQVVCGFDLY